MNVSRNALILIYNYSSMMPDIYMYVWLYNYSAQTLVHVNCIYLSFSRVQRYRADQGSI